ncbi:hypothetical protein HH212_21940 [Massilia forsythiae]|uniref:Adhesin n=1 Tax=Massilia forsythiae TaxID=2728020 RepID=A0A7Z2W081_9BURK|nr:hypothetical protein [Massilia forsythiae]QJE02354.1 hypothetical protein HH212_21940 [Massilia forsythiae]
MRLPLQIALTLAGAALAAQALAASPQVVLDRSQFVSQQAVDPATLDDYRGGFVTDTGLSVSLGLERIVTINGNVADRTSIELGDLGSLTSGKTTLSGTAANQLMLIQNGAAQSLQAGASLLGGTIIQNSLNDQLINNATIINASVNARGMLQSMNFQSTLSNALNTAATGR